MTFDEFVDAIDEKARESWTESEAQAIVLDNETLNASIAWHHGIKAVWIRPQGSHTVVMDRVESRDPDRMSGIAPAGGDPRPSFFMNRDGVAGAARFLDWLRSEL